MSVARQSKNIMEKKRFEKIKIMVNFSFQLTNANKGHKNHYISCLPRMSGVKYINKFTYCSDSLDPTIDNAGSSPSKCRLSSHCTLYICPSIYLRF